jgi:hypothetical protein
MDEASRRERANLIRGLAENAGPWAKERLLKLAARYEDLPAPAQPRPSRQAIFWPVKHDSER